MDTKKIKIYIKLHWVKLLLFFLGAVIAFFTLIVLIAGINAMINLESFYKQLQFSAIPLQFFISVITAIIFASIYTVFNYWFFFSGGMTKLGQKRVKSEEVNIKWNEVIGMEEVKRDAWEVVQLLKDRAQLQAIGGQIIKGLLLCGPPGVGKTYLAKAIATEVKVPFLSVVGSEIEGILVGLGAAKLKSLFKQARALAELHGGCIVFIDEIDSVARPRREDMGFGGGQMSANAAVNQLLTEMDGLRKKESNIVVIGATNVPEYQLDPALMRAGRFDRKIYIPLPGLKDRDDLFKFYLSKVKFDPGIDTAMLARKCVYKTPADISNIIREASLLAIRNKKEKISFKEITEAIDRIDFGLRQPIELSPKQKEQVAYHEAGHAIIAYLLHPTDDVFKASIIPRAHYLGMVYHQSREEMHIHNKEYYLANIKVAIASYVAEKIKFNTTTSGVDVDFRQALNYAYNMAWRWGMGPSGLLGNFKSLEEEYSTRLWGNITFISEQTREKLNTDAQQIIQDCLKEVQGVLEKETQLLDRFAQELLKKQELDYDEIEAIFKECGKSRPVQT